MTCPRRSAPCAGKRIAPSKAPCGIAGSVTPSSLDFAPEGSEVRNQTSQYTVPSLESTFVPCPSALPTADASSAGGGPAGSLLYCAKAAPAATTIEKSNLRIKAKIYCNWDGG